MGDSPWGHKESDMTKQLTLSLSRGFLGKTFFQMFKKKGKYFNTQVKLLLFAVKAGMKNGNPFC